MHSDRAAADRDATDDFDGLLRAVKAGRPSAWDQLYRWLSPAIAGYLRLRGAHDVEDVTSEVFLAIFRNIETFDGTAANFRSWAFVIAHRRLQDQRRRRFRKPPGDSFDESSERGDIETIGGDVEDDALAALATERVQAICARLAPDQADVMLLRILGDLTVEQVAEVLGKSPGAVKQLQRRAFEAVRKHLREAPTESAAPAVRAEGVPL